MDYWRQFALCYLLTIVIETPVLLVGLSGRHPMGRRLFAGAWLTACTYPIVFIVLPEVFGLNGPLSEEERTRQWLWYIVVAEAFAPAAECLLFWLAFRDPAAGKASLGRDLATVVAANLASFGVGLLFIYLEWLPFVLPQPV